MGREHAAIRPQSTLSARDAARERWDAIVIGAGPAGCVAAHELARGGRRTLLVDRAAPPRGKVCGCCLAPDGVQRLGRLGLDGVLEGAEAVRSIELRSGSSCAVVRREGYAVLSREALDARLAAAAIEAGARAAWRVSASVHPDGLVRLRSAEGDVAVRAAAVIAADGVNGSSLRDVPEMAPRVARRSLQGAGARLEADTVAIEPGGLMMATAREGYVGLVRLEDGRLDAAAALRPGAMRQAGGPGALAARVLESCGIPADGVRRARWRGTALLTRRRRAACGRVFAVGDAAGYAEPLTGEGMSWAIESGEAIARALLDRPVGAVGLDQLWRRRHATLRRRQRLCRGVCAAARSPAIVRGVCGLAARRPSVAERLASFVGRPASGAAS